MKIGIGLVCSLLLWSSTVFADVTWILSSAVQCDTVCGDEKMKPVPLGKIGNYQKSFVCRAEMTSGSSNDKGRRAGYTTDKVDDIGCAIAGGERANDGRISSTFDCLCVGK
jgi:hypothetical protein